MRNPTDFITRYEPLFEHKDIEGGVSLDLLLGTSGQGRQLAAHVARQELFRHPAALPPDGAEAAIDKS